jgi:hypothetical protein
MHLNIHSDVEKLIERAAAHHHQSVDKWAEDVLQEAAEKALHPEGCLHSALTMCDTLKRIDRRLANIENSPLQDGARYISQGAKTVADSARDIYSHVEGQPWFERSREMVVATFGTISDEVKSWFKPEDKKKSKRKKK